MHDELDTAPGAENYEQRDAHLKPILISGAILVTVTCVAYLTGYVIMNGFESRGASTDYVQSPIAGERTDTWAPGLRLQESPPDEYKALAAQHHAELTGWDTVSQVPVVYQIPVEIAIDIVAQNGLPKISAVPAADAAAADAPATEQATH